MLIYAIRDGENILVAGGTKSGKSILLGVLAELGDAIPNRERILLIADTAALHIRKPHIASLESQTDTHHDNITFDALLKAVLRHRPDRIIVGEVRGQEARTALLDAVNTGNRGTLARYTQAAPRKPCIVWPEALRDGPPQGSLAIRGGASLPVHVAEADASRTLDLNLSISRRNGRRHVEDVRRVR